MPQFPNERFVSEDLNALDWDLGPLSWKVIYKQTSCSLFALRAFRNLRCCLKNFVSECRKVLQWSTMATKTGKGVTGFLVFHPSPLSSNLTLLQFDCEMGSFLFVSFVSPVLVMTWRQRKVHISGRFQCHHVEVYLMRFYLSGWNNVLLVGWRQQRMAGKLREDSLCCDCSILLIHYRLVWAIAVSCPCLVSVLCGFTGDSGR